LVYVYLFLFFLFFFFQAEDGIRDAQESRGLGDVYKRQGSYPPAIRFPGVGAVSRHQPPAIIGTTSFGVDHPDTSSVAGVDRADASSISGIDHADAFPHDARHPFAANDGTHGAAQSR